MSSPLKTLGVTPAAKGYYSTRWRKGIEAHLVELRKISNSDVMPIQNLEGYRTRFDFFAFLTQKKIPERFHWAVLRVNGFKSPQDFTEDTVQVLIPKISVLQTLYSKIMQ